MPQELVAVMIADLLGIVLASILIWGNWWRLKQSSTENISIMIVISISLLSCVFDIITFLLDGHPGTFNRVLLLIGNTYLFAANLISALAWVVFFTKHLTGKINKLHYRIMLSMTEICLIMLVGNFFYPYIFGLDEHNRYFRGFLFYLLLAVDVAFLLYSVVVYTKSKQRAGGISLFPITIYLIPIFSGIVLQMLFKNISLIWVTVIISLAGILTSMQNEVIFKDALTGVYGRAFLEYALTKYFKNNNSVTGIMLDLNFFKMINDNYGHAEGDEALRITAKILCEATGDIGTVFRFAGDEFIILLNTQNENMVKTCINDIHSKFEEFNKTNQKPYRLSISAGYQILDTSKAVVDDFMNEIDKRMYIEKKRFYAGYNNNS